MYLERTVSHLGEEKMGPVALKLLLWRYWCFPVDLAAAPRTHTIPGNQVHEKLSAYCRWCGALCV